FIERLRGEPSAADLRLATRVVKRIGKIAGRIGQQDLARAIGVLRFARHLVDHAGALHLASIAIVDAADDTSVEIAIGTRGVAVQHFAVDGADMLPLPRRDKFTGGEPRAVLWAHIP